MEEYLLWNSLHNDYPLIHDINNTSTLYPPPNNINSNSKLSMYGASHFCSIS